MKKPKFKAKPGQIDYSKARWAPVINCVLKHGDKILLVERSKDLNFYPGYWNGISGFLDDKKTIKEKIVEEIREELGMPKSKIKSLKYGNVFDQDEKKYKKTWIVHPVLVYVATDKVKLDWEAGNHAWVTLEEARKMKLLPGFDIVLDSLFGAVGHLDAKTEDYYSSLPK